MVEIIKKDFGKANREAQRHFNKLMGLVEKTEEDFLNNPIRFFEEAGKRIRSLHLHIELAREALMPRCCITIGEEEMPSPTIVETVVVLKDEYERLKACAKTIQSDPFPQEKAK